MKVRFENCPVILSRGPFYTPYKSKRATHGEVDISNTESFKKNFFIWKKTSVTDRKKVFANTLNSEGLISIGTDSKNQREDAQTQQVTDKEYEQLTEEI